MVRKTWQESKVSKTRRHQWAVDEEASRLVERQDFIKIAILVAIALVIGVYLIATTILIAKDGILYIEQAQNFSEDPAGIIKAHPPGYPFLILTAHKFATLFSNGSSVHSWIYSAQWVTLLCRLIAIIPLYFIGRLLIGSKKSFWAILIVVILPYPAKIGCDALRDWPHILFLASGFWALLWGAKQGKWWMFGVAGLAAGAGYIIRPECAQLVMYGVLWLLIRLLLPKHNMNRSRMLCALFILLIGFAVPAAPYIMVKGTALPPKLRDLIKSSCRSHPDKIQERNVYNSNHVCTDVSLPGNITRAIGRLISRISEHLMYFFVPALLIGIYSRLRKQSVATDIERFFMPAFIVLNVIMMILLYCNYEYISRRHCLPLVVFTIFYVPVGLRILADWLRSRFSKNLETDQNPQLWFFILLAIGVTVCLPKLVRPVRIEKQGYRDAAEWLRENTAPADVIAVPDRRISFYAERKGLIYDKKVPKQAKYAVRIVKNGSEPKFGRTVQKRHSVWVNKRGRGKKITIYEVL